MMTMMVTMMVAAAVRGPPSPHGPPWGLVAEGFLLSSASGFL